jgi:hypothetical protein
MNTSPLKRGLRLAALVALALPAARAQDAAPPSHEDRAALHLQRVQEHLDLDAAQAALVEEAVKQREPGALWGAAAALAPTLSSAQQARLTAPPERADRAARRAPRPDRHAPPDGDRRGERRDRTARPPEEGRPDRPMRPDRTAGFEAMKEARNAALGLRADQIAALEQLEAERRRAWQEARERNERPAPPEAPRAESPLPPGIAEILDPEQETVWLVYQALTGPHRMPHGGPHGGPDGGPRPGRD